LQQFDALILAERFGRGLLAEPHRNKCSQAFARRRSLALFIEIRLL